MNLSVAMRVFQIASISAVKRASSKLSPACVYLCMPKSYGDVVQAQFIENMDNMQKRRGQITNGSKLVTKVLS